MGGDPWEPKGSHGRGPLEAQGNPWEKTLGSPREPTGGEHWEPKGSHGRGPLGAQGIPWEGTLGSQGIPWQGTLGSTREFMGGDPWEYKGIQGMGPLGAPGISWEGTLGSPRDPMGGDPGEPGDYLGSLWRQLGSPGTILQVFCDEVTFQDIQKSGKTIFQVFRVKNDHPENPYLSWLLKPLRLGKTMEGKAKTNLVEY